MSLENLAAIRIQIFWKSRRIVAVFATFGVLLFGGIRLDSSFAEDASKTDPATTVEDKGLEYRCRVVNKETGQGIPNVRVTVLRSVDKAGANRIIKETKYVTDADGFYDIIIPPDQLAMNDLYITVLVEHNDYKSERSFGGLLGAIRHKESLGERPSFEKIELSPGEAVTGTVVSPDGKPLQGIKVQTFSVPISRERGTPISSSDCVTDAQGQFGLALAKDAESILWIIPKDFAPIEKFLAKKRGDLGTFKLTEGIRVSAQVKSVEGKPLSGVAVNIQYSGTRAAVPIPVASYVRRGAISDTDGHVEFDPLPPGDYTVTPSESLTDPLKRGPANYEIPGVFMQQKITIKDGASNFSVAIQAVPHVVLCGQCYDSKGEKRADNSNRNFANRIRISGQLDGLPWSSMGRPDAQGAFSILVPHGLQRTRVQAISVENQIVRYRLGKEGALQNRTEVTINLGMMNDDIGDFEIYYFKSPVVLVSAVDEEQKPVPGFQVVAVYPWGQQRFVVKGGGRSDISFTNEADGSYRTRQMLPDEEVTFKLTAPDFEPAEKTVKLAEGEKQELVVTMKRGTGEKPK